MVVESFFNIGLYIAGCYFCIGLYEFECFQYYRLHFKQEFGNFIRNYIHYNDYANTASDDWGRMGSVLSVMVCCLDSFVAVFVAKISKGTIRECAWGVVLFPAVFEAVWFGIFSSAGLPVKEQLYAAMQDNLPQSVFFLLHQLASGGGYGFIGIGHGSDLFFFFITSSDSSSYVVATILSDEVRSLKK